MSFCRSATRFVVKWLIVLAVCSGAGYMLFASVNHSGPDEVLTESIEPPLRRIQVSELTPRSVEEKITLPGSVVAIQDINLAATTPGTVEWVGVEEGDPARIGQPLFRIDQRARKARVEDASAAYELAVKNFERRRGLQETGIISPDQLDSLATALKRAEAALNVARTELSLSVVTSPINGFVDRIDVDEGEYAHEGETLAHLVDIDTVKIVVGTPERDVRAVAAQNDATVSIDALNGTFPGRISHVAYAANERTNTFETTILVDNPDHLIRPGMVARATIVTAHYDHAISIPLFSIIQTLDGPIVFTEEGGTVQSVPVEIGGIEGDQATILDGLKEGDRLVVVGQRDLADGQKVEVVPPSSSDVVISNL